MKEERTERQIIAEAYSDDAQLNWKAPVQGYPGGIPWAIHLEAYEAYCKKWSKQTALIDLKGRGCRGGFGTEELDGFVPGWRDRVAMFGRLKARVDQLDAIEQQRANDIEAMGEALTGLSERLKAINFFDFTINHVAYENVTKAWEKFQ